MDPHSPDIVLVYMLKDSNSLDYHWVSCWFICHFSIFLIDCGLFYVNQGIRPYADVCVCVCVCVHDVCRGKWSS